MSTATIKQAHVPVLIVGAGPVGLAAAIRLRLEGVDVRIIDEQPADQKRTYPVLLHARTLRVLDTLGVTAPLEWRGHAVMHLGIYTDGQPRATLDLPSAGYIAPGALTLPQDVLRRALMQRLSTLGTEVEWQTRVVGLEQDDRGVRVNLVHRERVEGKAPELKPEWLDVSAKSLDAHFVVGADGCRSTLRQLLGVGWESRGQREIYVFYDAPDERGGDARLALQGDAGSTVYPVQGGISRFSFQIGVGIPHEPGLAQLQQLLKSRMPWWRGDLHAFEWSGSAEFHPALASTFGAGRVWLAGDAAHVTGPLGGQSLNVGIHEADDLGLRLIDALGHPASASFGARYSEQRRLEWQRLFGPPAGLTAPNSLEWLSRYLARLLPALPASGDDLDDLLDQLRVRIA